MKINLVLEKNKYTLETILILRLVTDRNLEKNNDIFIGFVNLQKASNHINLKTKFNLKNVRANIQKSGN